MRSIERLILFLLLLVPGITSRAQTNTSTTLTPAGATFVQANFQGQWSLGEITAGTIQTTSFHAAHSFVQQRNPYINVTSLEEKKQLIHYSTYPNPVKDILTIEQLGTAERVVYKLYNAHGNLLNQTQWSADGNKKIDMLGYPDGIYFLLVHGEQYSKPRKFKIIKGNDE